MRIFNAIKETAFLLFFASVKEKKSLKRHFIWKVNKSERKHVIKVLKKENCRAFKI